MASRKDTGMRLRGIPFSILAVVGILWTTAAIGLVEAGPEWIDYTHRRDGSLITAALLFGLTFAHLVNAVLGLAIQLHRNWARTTAIGLSLFRTATALVAMVAGETPSTPRIALNLAIVVLLLFPSAANWCDR